MCFSNLKTSCEQGFLWAQKIERKSLKVMLAVLKGKYISKFNMVGLINIINKNQKQFVFCWRKYEPLVNPLANSFFKRYADGVCLVGLRKLLKTLI